MTFEQRDNSGALFKNDRKEKPSHPDYRGSLMVAGLDHWVSAWIKTDKNGNKFMSLSVQPKNLKEAAEKASAPKRQSAAGEFEAERRADARLAKKIEDLDDEIPF